MTVTPQPPRPPRRWMVRLHPVHVLRFGELAASSLRWTVVPYEGRFDDGVLKAVDGMRAFHSRDDALAYAHRESHMHEWIQAVTHPELAS